MYPEGTGVATALGSERVFEILLYAWKLGLPKGVTVSWVPVGIT